ncbi:hypothetical protein [Bartonella tamiae]|uniref:Uncharacterized protein n=1 Tax=Bartonella tamiae Th239 TaxID=1094558 RepID=J1JZE1_9HYPH|nr:hypothetical protein [Bartonella tamiae]EJF90482.1 hypothetical protein ME5_00883 [Bartonella tamiae Th239]
MANFSAWLKTTIKRMLLYIVGIIIILSILLVGGFYIAKPHLESFVASEMTKRGVKADSSKISLFGNVSLTNVRLPVPDDIDLKIGALSGRPPIAFLPGSFTLYDIELQRDNIRLQIPQISISGVSLHDKDSSINAKILQTLHRVSISSVNAPTMLLSVTTPNGTLENLDIKGFWISGFKNGTIGSIGLTSMNTNIGLASLTSDINNPMRFVGKSDAMRAQNIDIAYAYSILTQSTSTAEEGKTLIGPVALTNLDIDIFDGTQNNLHLIMGQFNTDGLKMRPMNIVAENVFKTYLDAKKSGNEEAKKAQKNILIHALINSITSIDARIENSQIETTKLKAALKAFQLKPNNWNQPIPESLLLSIDGFSLDTNQLPPKDAELFQNLGLETINLSGKLDFSYHSNNKRLSLNSLSFDAPGIGSGDMTATVVDVEPNVFSGNKEDALMAAANIGVTAIDMRYSDFGFIDKFLTYLSQSLDDDEHNLKKELYEDFYIAMTRTPLMILKDHDEAEKISKEFGKFAQNPGTLKISMRAKDNKGLTSEDLEQILDGTLSDAMNKIDLNVEAQ